MDRTELGTFFFTAERYDPMHAALGVLLGLNGLRVSEACGANLASGERHEGPILCRRDGQRLDLRTAHRWVRSIGRRAGLGVVHPHMLRAGFIMAALDAGVPLQTSSSPLVTPTPARPRSMTGAARHSTARDSTATPPMS